MYFLSALLLAATVMAEGTTYYIDQQPLNPQYNALQTCARSQVRTVIKDMYSGCGISPSTSYTSFDCFCTSSFTSMQWVLEKAILSACNTDGYGSSSASQQVGSALDLYSSYCQLPLMAAATAGSASASATQSTLATSAIATAAPGGSVPAAGAANTSPAQTAAPTASHHTSLSTGAIVGIVVGAVGFCILLALAIVALFLIRRRRKSSNGTANGDGIGNNTSQVDGLPMLVGRPGPDSRTGSDQSGTGLSNREATSPAEVFTPSNIRGANAPWGEGSGRAHSDSSWTGETMVQQLEPTQLSERRLTPLAELARDGPELKELEGEPVSNVAARDRAKAMGKHGAVGGLGGVGDKKVWI